MSLSLNWYEPPARPTSIDGCRHPLKGILAERYLGNDGSLYGEFMLGREDLSYIQGLADADVENAQELLAALLQYGSLLLKVEE